MIVIGFDGPTEIPASLLVTLQHQIADAHLVEQRPTCPSLAGSSFVVIDRVQIAFFGAQLVSAPFQFHCRGARSWRFSPPDRWRTDLYHFCILWKCRECQQES